MYFIFFVQLEQPSIETEIAAEKNDTIWNKLRFSDQLQF